MSKKALQWFGISGGDGVSVFQFHAIVRYVSAILLSVIVVRSALGAFEVYTFEWLLFLGMMTTAFWSNGIKNGLMAKYSSEDPSAAVYPWAAFLLLQFLTAMLVGFLFLCGERIAGQITSIYDFQISGWFLLYLFFSTPVLLVEILLFLREEYNTLYKYALWSALLPVLSVLLIVWAFPSVGAVFMVLSFWSFLRWIYLLKIMPAWPGIRIAWPEVRSLAAFSVPLVFLMLLGSAMEMTDGLLVTHFFSTDVFPAYRYGARELPFSAMMFTSLGTAMIPMIRKDAMQAQLLRKRVTSLMHVLFPLSILAVWLSYPVFSFIYGQEYALSGTIFSIYLLVIGSRCWMPQVFQQAKHQHSILLFASITELAVNIVLSLWWMKEWGMQGLVAATVVAYGVEKGILIIHNRFKNGISAEGYMPLRLYALYMLALVVSLFFSMRFYAR